MNLLSRLSSVSKLWASGDDEARQRAKEEAREHLSLAVAQRAGMTVTFPEAQPPISAAVGPCMKIAGKEMFIEASLPEDALLRGNEPVSVSFRLERGTGASFYRFDGTVLKHTRYGDAPGIWLRCPESLQSNQRRCYVRVSPNPAMVSILDIWMVEGETESEPIAVPPAQAREGNAESDAFLANISAGGLRLKLNAGSATPALSAADGARLLCFLRLKNALSGPAPAKTPQQNDAPPEKPPLEIWLDCTVNNREEQAETASLFLGMAFTGWAVPVRQEGAPLNWSPAGENGMIPPLSGWIHQLQLAQAARISRLG